MYSFETYLRLKSLLIANQYMNSQLKNEAEESLFMPIIINKTIRQAISCQVINKICYTLINTKFF